MQTRLQKKRGYLSNSVETSKADSVVLRVPDAIATLHFDDALEPKPEEPTSFAPSALAVVSSACTPRKAHFSIKDIEDAAATEAPLPADFAFVWQGIQDMRVARDAPVDLMGCDKLADTTCDPKVQRFHHLTAVFLSSQTADRSTAACMERLKAYGLTVDSIAACSVDALEGILKGVSFHKTKAKNLIRIATILQDQYDGDIPDTYEALCSLPGIGPKMALIALSSAWNRTEGIAVDVHVHRIANRLGWIQTKTPEESCLALARVIPRPLWNDFNSTLVGFGQQRCKALHPLCDTCLIRQRCPSVQLKKSKLRMLKN